MLKRVFRIATLLSLVVVVAACGRRLPDEYFQTTTDFAEEPVDSVAVAESSDEEAGVEVEASDDAEIEETASEESSDEAVEEEPETEVAADAESTEPQVELVAVPLDPIIEQVASADEENGEALMSAGVPCTSCHILDSEDMLVGPGFLNIPIRAENRIEGVVAERYLYNSVAHPNEYVVEGYAQGVMPSIYGETYSESDILDIVAYLMTLGEYPEREPQFIEVVVESSDTESASATDEESSTEAADTSSDESETTETEDTSEDTVEVAEAGSGEIDLSGVPASVEFLAEHGSSIQGAALFETPLVNGMSCATCHSVDGNPSDSQSDLSEIAQVDNAPAYIWAAIFNNGLHPGLGPVYEQELTGAETSHLLAYLMSFNETEDE